MINLTIPRHGHQVKRVTKQQLIEIVEAERTRSAFALVQDGLVVTDVQKIKDEMDAALVPMIAGGAK